MANTHFKDNNTEVRIEQTHSIVNQSLFFFHRNGFIKRKKDTNPIFFNLYQKNSFCVSIAFEIVNNEAISLPQSPFGGFIVEKPIDQELLQEFLEVIINYFKERKLNIHIKLSSDCYSPFGKTAHASLINTSFSTLYIEVNQHITIESKSFIQKANRNRNRKLKLCVNQDFSFEKLDISYLSTAHELITECRVDKGYPVTMTLKELQTSFVSFPANYFLFGVFDKKELIAAAISVKVNHRILYNFYHGDRLTQRQNSPVTLLVSGIYAYCQQQQFEILDLGISTNQGALNKGLYSFKESCGAISSDKRSYLFNL